MRVEYDRESDTLYIEFKGSKIADTRMFSEDLYANLDNVGIFVGDVMFW
jgi:uncharacterized protein YuzE